MNLSIGHRTAWPVQRFDQGVELAKGRATAASVARMRGLAAGPGGKHHVELVQRLAGGPVNQDRIDLGAGLAVDQDHGPVRRGELAVAGREQRQHDRAEVPAFLRRDILIAGWVDLVATLSREAFPRSGL
jgi:hypothetical protein